MDYSELHKGSNEFSFQPLDYKLESKAAAGAMRALQEKIRMLEIEKSNLENHINYLYYNIENSQKRAVPDRKLNESSTQGETVTEKLWKFQENYELLMSKSEFYEKELLRKDQQYQIDYQTWELEKKNLIKSLEKARGAIKSPRSKTTKAKTHGKTEDQTESFISKINSLTDALSRSEKTRTETEERLSSLHKQYDQNLFLLQKEIQEIKDANNSRLKDSYETTKELDYYKSLSTNQKFQIESLTLEINSLKNRHKKPENINAYTKEYNKPQNNDAKTYHLNDLEAEVDRLSKKYKNLLDRTRNPTENCSDLRSELRQTALDLEVQSFNLYQLRRDDHNYIKDRYNQ
jgi:chromosome segregation ATPase